MALDWGMGMGRDSGPSHSTFDPQISYIDTIQSQHTMGQVDGCSMKDSHHRIIKLIGPLDWEGERAVGGRERDTMPPGAPGHVRP